MAMRMMGMGLSIGHLPVLAAVAAARALAVRAGNDLAVPALVVMLAMRTVHTLPVAVFAADFLRGLRAVGPRRV